MASAQAPGRVGSRRADAMPEWSAAGIPPIAAFDAFVRSAGLSDLS